MGLDRFTYKTNDPDNPVAQAAAFAEVDKARFRHNLGWGLLAFITSSTWIALLIEVLEESL